MHTPHSSNLSIRASAYSVYLGFICAICQSPLSFAAGQDQRATISIEADRIDQTIDYVQVLVFRGGHFERKISFEIFQPANSRKYSVAHRLKPCDRLHRA